MPDRLRDAWDQFKDWWEWDDHFRQMIVLAALMGAISLAFACSEALAVKTIKGASG